MITLEIPVENDAIFFKFGFDFEFKQNVAFIKNNIIGRKWNPAYKRWEAPNIQKNIKMIRAFSSKFSNIEVLKELEQFETSMYLTVLDYKDNTKAIDFIYDTEIIHIIKSTMNYPKDPGFNGDLKSWIIHNDTWTRLKVKLVEYMDKIGERFEFPPEEDIEQIREDTPRRLPHPNLSENKFNEMTETIKLEYNFLRDYQARDVAVYECNNHILNANQMGLGKTIETGAFISLEKPDKVLVVVPNSLKVQWSVELNKFFPDLSSRIVVINGTKAKRAKLWSKVLNRKKYIIITNYANLRTKDYIEFGLNKIMFDLLVFDEITKCKNHKTSTFQMAAKLQSKMVVGLTGTPIENHLKDIFTIMKIIFPTFFGPWIDFARKYFYKGGYQNREWIEKPGAARDIADELKEFPGFIRWNRKSVLKELPELLINTYRIKLTGPERKAYELLEQKMLEVRDKNGYVINTKNILSLILALRRICSDPEIYDIKFKNSAKKSEFVRVVKDNVNGKKLVAFSQFKDCIYLYSDALTKAGIKNVVLTGDTKMSDRDQIIDEFQKSEDAKVLMCTDAFAYGKNLQFCSVLINIDQHFNPAVIQQRIGRIQRIGQKEKVLNVINFLVENSIEEFVYNKIMRKNILFDAVITTSEKEFNYMDSMKEYFKEKSEA